MFYINSGRIRGLTLCIITYMQCRLFEFFFDKNDIGFLKTSLVLSVIIFLSSSIYNFFEKKHLISYKMFTYLFGYITIFNSTYLLTMANCNSLLVLMFICNVFILYLSIDTRLFFRIFFIFFIPALILNIVDDKITFSLKFDTLILIINIIAIISIGYFIKKSQVQKMPSDLLGANESFKNIIVKNLVQTLMADIVNIIKHVNVLKQFEQYIPQKNYIKKIQDATMEIKYLSNILIKPTATTASEIIHIKDCIQQAINEYPFSLKELQLIHIEQDSIPFQLSCDKELIFQILYNLFRNALFAIKIMKKGEIYIKYYNENKDAFIHVKDTAGALTPDNVFTIFDSSVDQTGQKLGFQFCKEAVNALNGKIECRTLYNKYTEFVIFIPL